MVRLKDQVFTPSQKNPCAHKNKIGTPPPPPKKPPKKGEILWIKWFFLQKERIFPGVHKIGAPISGPRIADTNFTDTRIFLTIILLALNGKVHVKKGHFQGT